MRPTHEGRDTAPRTSPPPNFTPPSLNWRPSEEALAKGATYQRATGTDGLVGAKVSFRSQLGVDFNQVDSDQLTGKMDGLADVVTLA